MAKESKRPNKKELQKLVNHFSQHRIAKKMGVTPSAVWRWMKYHGIESKKHDYTPNKPTKTELRKLVKRMPKSEIAKRIGVCEGTIYTWMKEYGIKVGSHEFIIPGKRELGRLCEEHYICDVAKQLGMSYTTLVKLRKEYGLPVPSSKKPSKKELNEMYNGQHMSFEKIGDKLGVPLITVYLWAKSYHIKIRDASEAMLPAGFVVPSKEELEKMFYDQGMNYTQIAAKVGVSDSSIRNWMESHNIRPKSDNVSAERFIRLVKKDPAALALAFAATQSNGLNYDFEKVIMEVYGGKFKDQKQLHELLEESSETIKGLVDQGVTNLGAYIGGFSLGERRIFPIVIDGAISAVPDDKITASLEERMARMLRIAYSPKFNDNPQKVMKELERKVGSYEGKRKQIYEKLVEHYRDVLRIGEELS